MSKRDFSDEDLMRFADGELDAATRAALERAMETDEQLVSRAALFIETRQAAKTALKPLLDEPVPAHLAESVANMVAAGRDAATVLPFKARPAAGAAGGRWLLPIAASIAAILGGLSGYWLANTRAPVPSLVVGGVSTPALDEALATVASGAESQLPGSDQRLRAIATFLDSSNTLCREFEVDSSDRSTVVSVACRSDGAWLVTFAVAAPGNDDGYAPVSSTDALEAYLAAIHAGQPMEAAAETKALEEIRGGDQK